MKSYLDQGIFQIHLSAVVLRSDLGEPGRIRLTDVAGDAAADITGMKQTLL